MPTLSLPVPFTLGIRMDQQRIGNISPLQLRARGGAIANSENKVALLNQVISALASLAQTI